ncbi:MAG TPA: hypothetical protein DDY13_07890 [Cytophagales bacterium]|jgi:tetratricopeptide (TPR) repeat protein|nr:hypothetical protein [Cytophagales bacterium]
MKMNNKKLHLKIVLVIAFLASGAIIAKAQMIDPDNEFMNYLDKGRSQMENGDYELAEASFKQVLNNVNVLPAEICYYFGKNSYFLKKYKQSINWLNKYIELKGTRGQYFEESKEYLALAEDAYRDTRQTESGQELITENEVVTEFTFVEQIDCFEGDKIVCPVCRGKTVIIKQGAFGRTYETCPYCNDHGLLTCDEYNLLLQGKLEPRR